MAAGKILAISGSTRDGSFTKKLLKIAVDATRAAGGDVTEIDLRDYPMPLYDGDLEASSGLPEQAIALREVFKDHSALLIGTTEYNGGVTGVLKNAIDWVSRPHGDDANAVAIAGKTVAIISASAGIMGGARAQAAWRTSFQVLQCVLVPQTVTLPACHAAFNEDGSLKDDAVKGMTDLVGQKLAELVAQRG
jgi:chromate reductase, NAD(P)H dehydrogenase (quinone)